MSVVIMVRSGKELFLFGDKKSTHINNFDREKETYEEQSVSYDSRKVYQVKDDIIIGMVGSSLGYDNFAMLGNGLKWSFPNICVTNLLFVEWKFIISTRE